MLTSTYFVPGTELRLTWITPFESHLLGDATLAIKEFVQVLMAGKK